MSDRELRYLTDFAALMATRKYGKVPSGHPFGSQLGVRFDCSQNKLHRLRGEASLPPAALKIGPVS